MYLYVIIHFTLIKYGQHFPHGSTIFGKTYFCAILLPTCSATILQHADAVMTSLEISAHITEWSIQYVFKPNVN